MSNIIKQKSFLIQKILNKLYPNPPVPLNSSDTFTFLIAVVLSAQTTDGKVNEVTKELFNLAPTPHIMATMSPQHVESIIRTVGLAPRKAQNIVNLSKILLDKFNGQVPCTYEDLESLPGVGHKTASVVMSQSFGEPAIAVDTHVHRLALRWGLSKDEKNVDKVQKDLMNIFPIEDWNRLHLQMIYFGREYCTAKDHTPPDCPICSWVSKSLAEIDLDGPIDLSGYSTTKKHKGIVYYGDRTEELLLSPSLSIQSTPKFDVVKNIVVDMDAIKSNLNISLEECLSLGADIITSVPKNRQKRSSEATKEENVDSAPVKRRTKALEADITASVPKKRKKWSSEAIKEGSVDNVPVKRRTKTPPGSTTANKRKKKT